MTWDLDLESAKQSLYVSAYRRLALFLLNAVESLIYKAAKRFLFANSKILEIYSIHFHLPTIVIPTSFFTKHFTKKLFIMTTFAPKLCLFGLFLAFGMFGLGEPASGVTTRYWDCCKPSCAWPGKAQVSKAVNTCNIGDQYDYNSNAQSGCGGGSAYSCSIQEPWAVNDGLAYGFAAVKLAGMSEWDWCCACYRYVK